MCPPRMCPLHLQLHSPRFRCSWALKQSMSHPGWPTPICCSLSTIHTTALHSPPPGGPHLHHPWAQARSPWQTSGIMHSWTPPALLWVASMGFYDPIKHFCMQMHFLPKIIMSYLGKKAISNILYPPQRNYKTRRKVVTFFKKKKKIKTHLWTLKIETHITKEHWLDQEKRKP